MDLDTHDNNNNIELYNLDESVILEKSQLNQFCAALQHVQQATEKGKEPRKQRAQGCLAKTLYRHK
jgi:hypothetical protein